MPMIEVSIFFACLLPHPSNFFPAGNIVSLDKFGDPFLAAVLIKKYLRDLPESIIPEKLYPIIRRCPQPISNPSDINAVIYVRDVFLPELIPCAYILLSNVLREYFVFILTLYQVSTNEQISYTISLCNLTLTKWMLIILLSFSVPILSEVPIQCAMFRCAPFRADHLSLHQMQ